MIKNLFIYLKYQYRDEIDLYFTDIVKEKVEGDKQDHGKNRILYVIDKFMEEEKDFDDIGLGRAQDFLKKQKAQINIAKVAVA